MAQDMIVQPPLRLIGADKRDLRTQFAALPFRIAKKKGGHGVEILLVSSLDSGRWIVPKGWPMDGMTPAQAAAQEAWEEAGALGRMHDTCLGLYSYKKVIDKKITLPVMVAVFPLEVKTLKDNYPEAGARKRKWLSRKKAAGRVEEVALRHIIEDFTTDRLR